MFWPRAGKIPREFSISPMSGTVGPGESVPLQFAFEPSTNGETAFLLRILHNGSKPLQIPVVGIGGSGIIEPEFLSSK